MKKLIKRSAIFAMFFPLAAFAQSGNYTVSGKVRPLGPNAKVYLVRMTSEGQKIDSAAVTDGEFTFNGTIENPETGYVMINPDGVGGMRSRNVKGVQIMFEPGNIKVTSKDTANNIDIVGGELNADNTRLQDMMTDVDKRTEALRKEYFAASPEKRKSQEFMYDITKRSNEIEADRAAIIRKFIEQNPNSLMSLFALKQYAGAIMDVPKIEPLYNSLAANVRNTKLGKDYAAAIEKNKRIGIGAVAPDFTSKDTLGKEVALHDFKGKYVLVDFWASWCGPCRAENPNVVKAYGEYHPKGFEVLGVSLDQPNAKDKWMKAIHDDHLTWTQISNLQGWKDQVAALYSVRAIPQNFLIGPDGKIVAKDIRGEELTKKLVEIFGN